MFRDNYVPYTVTIDGTTLPGFFMIGGKHIFTSIEPSQDPYKACVEMQVEDEHTMLLNSYYDEPTVRDKCQAKGYYIPHDIMFTVLGLLAFYHGKPRIVLDDGSRKILSGCEWNLRIMNRLLHPEKSTFYEKFGFKAFNEILQNPAGLRISHLKPYLPDHSLVMKVMHTHNMKTLKQLVKYMYTRCNGDHYDMYKELEYEIIGALDARAKLIPNSRDNILYYKDVYPTHDMKIIRNRIIFTSTVKKLK